MTKKINWRLKEQPTTESLQKLVSSGILTKDEAREILFNQINEQERDVESFKSEIKFLRELVDKLSQKSQTIQVIKEHYPQWKRFEWYQPYWGWCTLNETTITTDGNTTMYLNNTNADDVGVTNASYNFSDITTF